MADTLSKLAGFGSLASGVGNIFSSIYNQHQQAAENQKNREFTEYMYDKQVQNNIKMWNMQTSYDKPVNQIARMRQAGLNPDLMYNGAGVSAAPNLQSAAAGSPSSSPLPGVNSPNLGQAALESAQIDLMKAQARNFDADSRKKGFEGDILATDAEFERALKQQQLSFGDVQINLGNSQVKVNEETLPVLRWQCKQMEASVDNFNASVRNLDAQTLSQNWDNYIKSQTAQDLIDQCHYKTGIAKNELETFFTSLQSQLAVNASIVTANNAAAENSKASAKANESLAGKYDSEKNLNVATLKVKDYEFKAVYESGKFDIMLDCDVQNAQNDAAIRENNTKGQLSLYDNDTFFGALNYTIKETLGVAGQLLGGSMNYSAGGTNSHVYYHHN